MTRRLFNLLTALSLLLCVATILVMATPPERSPPYLLSDAGPRVELESQLLTVFNRGLPCFNVWVGSEARQSIAFDFEFADVHYRYYRLTDGTTWWALAMPPVLPFVLTAALPAVWLIAWSRRLSRAEAGLCTRCGYDLRATPDQCPECGTPPKAPAKRVPGVRKAEAGGVTWFRGLR